MTRGKKKTQNIKIKLGKNLQYTDISLPSNIQVKNPT